MLSPKYKIKVGDETLDTKISAEVVSISVTLDMSFLADFFNITLKRSKKTEKFKEGDEVSIFLGYGDELENVFNGKISHIDSDIGEIKISGLNSASNLLNLRVNQVYENQSAGNIVSDLAKRAKVPEGEISDGINFPFYFLSENKNAYEHIHDLAGKCGFDVYLTPDNKLNFKKYEKNEKNEKNSVHKLEYGKNIIESKFFEKKPAVTGVKIRGESPSSFKGSSTSHWLTKKDVESISGKGKVLLISDPSIKDKDTAEKVAKAKFEEIITSLSQSIRIPGNPKIKVCDTAEVKDMPNEKMNGGFKVKGVSHMLNKTDGFITVVECAGKVNIEEGDEAGKEAGKESGKESGKEGEKKEEEAPEGVSSGDKKDKEFEEKVEEKIKDAKKDAEENVKDAKERAQYEMEDVLEKAEEKTKEIEEKTKKEISGLKKEFKEKIKKANETVDDLKRKFEESKNKFEKSKGKAKETAEKEMNDAEKEFEKAKKDAEKAKEESEKEFLEKKEKTEKEALDSKKDIQKESDEAKYKRDKEIKEVEKEAEKDVDEARKTAGKEVEKESEKESEKEAGKPVIEKEEIKGVKEITGAEALELKKAKIMERLSKAEAELKKTKETINKNILQDEKNKNKKIFEAEKELRNAKKGVKEAENKVNEVDKKVDELREISEKNEFFDGLDKKEEIKNGLAKDKDKLSELKKKVDELKNFDYGKIKEGLAGKLNIKKK